MSFSRYPEYKDSGVEWLGEIPNHWEISPIKNLALVVNGFPFDSKHFSPEGRYPLVRIRDLNRSETDTYYDGEFLEAAAITAEDVLIGMDGDFNVGRWSGQGFALLNQRMCCIRGHTPLLSRLIEYALPFPLKAINEITYSTTVKHLSSFQVQKTFVALPPSMEEQTAIAAFLDRETSKIDELVAEQEKLIELLKEKRQAVISHAVTKGLDPNARMKDSGVEWLGEVPAHWEVQLLKRAFRSSDYGISDSLSPDGNIAVLRMGNIQNGQIVKDDLKFTDEVPDELLLEDGDLLFNRTNSLDLVGKVGLFNVDGSQPTSFASYLVRLRVRESYCPGYFSYLLNTPGILGEARSLAFVAIGQCNLNPTRYGQLVVAIPPPEEQQDIARFLDKESGQLDALIAEAQCAIDLLKERRSVLISAAVTGKIDVRGLVDALSFSPSQTRAE